MNEYRIVSVAERDYFALQDSRDSSVRQVVSRNEATKHRMLQAPFTVEERRLGSGPKAWKEVPVTEAEIEAIREEERRKMEAISAQNAQRRATA